MIRLRAYCERYGLILLGCGWQLAGNKILITRHADVQAALSRVDEFQVIYASSMDDSVGACVLGRDNTIYNNRDKGIMRALLAEKGLPDVKYLCKSIMTKLSMMHGLRQEMR